jgi:hypothetical protein
MPYAITSELPPAVRRLPLHGQEIFLSAFNNAWQTYADRGFHECEEVAFGSPGQRSKGVTATAARCGSLGACKTADREKAMAPILARLAKTEEIGAERVPAETDLVEWYFQRGWTDGLPVVPPTRGRVDEFVAALGGEPHLVECKVPPRHGSLTREVLAINMIMAGCKPEYAPVVRAAMSALTAKAFNLNGVQATTHMAAPLLIVNGPIARTIGMNGDCNAFGSGNRANATIGRALRLVLLNVGGGRPGDLDKSTLGHPGKYTYCVAENEAASPWAPYHVEKGFGADNSTVFVLAAEPPHSVTNHVANDPEGILDSICSAMSTIANNNAVSSGHCAVIIGSEHARTIAGKGWTRHDVRSYLHMNAYNLFSELTFNERYGKIYNRNLPRWYKREQGSRIPVVPDPDHIHLFVVGGEAGRLSSPAGAICRRRCCAASKATRSRI